VKVSVTPTVPQDRHKEYAELVAKFHKEVIEPDKEHPLQLSNTAFVMSSKEVLFTTKKKRKDTLVDGKVVIPRTKPGDTRSIFEFFPKDPTLAPQGQKGYFDLPKPGDPSIVQEIVPDKNSEENSKSAGKRPRGENDSGPRDKKQRIEPGDSKYASTSRNPPQ